MDFSIRELVTKDVVVLTLCKFKVDVSVKLAQKKQPPGKRNSRKNKQIN